MPLPRWGNGTLVSASALLWGLQFAFLNPSVGLLLVALYHATPAQVGDNTGLRTDWYSVFGNHDGLVQGNVPSNPLIQQIATGSKKINTAGYCLGGTLLMSTLAYMAAKKDTRVNSATFFTTMLDFTDPGELGVAAIGPAIANALFSATGLRFRRLPLLEESE